MEKILNEKKYIEKIINEEKLSINSHVAIRLLSKYYVIEGLKPKAIKTNILKILEKKLSKKKLSDTDWDDVIKKTINRIIRDKKKKEKDIKEYKLYEIDEICISKSELTKIRELTTLSENELIEDLAFIMLVNSKINYLRYNSDKFGVNCNKELFAEANLRFNLKNKSIINELKTLGYVNPSSFHQSDYVQLCYVDEELATDGIVITDFRDTLLNYWKWKGVKIGICACSRLFEVKSNSQKKCKSCSNADHLMSQRESMKNLRSKKYDVN